VSLKYEFTGLSLGHMRDEGDRLKVLINLLEDSESTSSASLEASRERLARVELLIKGLK
jgi:hypothetical protein